MRSIPIPSPPKTSVSWDCVECTCRLGTRTIDIKPPHLHTNYCVLCGHDSEFHFRTVNNPTWEKGYKAGLVNFNSLLDACEDLMLALNDKGVCEAELAALRASYLGLFKEKNDE